MDLNRDDPEHDRLESTWDRWQQLPLGYRVNAGVYVLAFICLVVLLAQVLTDSGGKPRQVEVASRAPTTTRLPRATTTSSTTTVPTTVTTVPPPPTSAASKPAASGTGRSSSGGSAATQPPDTQPIPGFPSQGPTDCRNSHDPACGAFSWDPPAGGNLPLVVTVDHAVDSTESNRINFAVVVTDGDHPVGDNCAVVDFGDGTVQRAPCQPLSCPGAFGPWTPPARSAGHATFTYGHTYASPGFYTATFEYHTDDDYCPDPYGNFGRAVAGVTAAPLPAP